MFLSIILNSWHIIILATIALYNSYLVYKYSIKLQKIHDKLIDAMKLIHENAKTCGEKPEFSLVARILNKQCEAIIETLNIISD